MPERWSGGYNAALIAEVVGGSGQVVSIDIDPWVTYLTSSATPSSTSGDGLDPLHALAAAMRDTARDALARARDAVAQDLALPAPVPGHRRQLFRSMRAANLAADAALTIDTRFEGPLTVPAAVVHEAERAASLLLWLTSEPFDRWLDEAYDGDEQAKAAARADITAMSDHHSVHATDAHETIAALVWRALRALGIQRGRMLVIGQDPEVFAGVPADGRRLDPGRANGFHADIPEAASDFGAPYPGLTSGSSAMPRPTSTTSSCTHRSTSTSRSTGQGLPTRDASPRSGRSSAASGTLSPAATASPGLPRGHGCPRQPLPRTDRKPRRARRGRTTASRSTPTRAARQRRGRRPPHLQAPAHPRQSHHAVHLSAHP